MDAYHFKQNAIEKIWSRLTNDAKAEKKRAIDIWKQKLSFLSHSQKVVKALLKKSRDRQCTQALHQWKNWSMCLENACRVKILQHDYTRKIFMSQVFY